MVTSATVVPCSKIRAASSNVGIFQDSTLAHMRLVPMITIMAGPEQGQLSSSRGHTSNCTTHRTQWPQVLWSQCHEDTSSMGPAGPLHITQLIGGSDFVWCASHHVPPAWHVGNVWQGLPTLSACPELVLPCSVGYHQSPYTHLGCIFRMGTAGRVLLGWACPVLVGRQEVYAVPTLAPHQTD